MARSRTALLLIILCGLAHAARLEGATGEVHQLRERVQQLRGQSRYEAALQVAKQLVALQERMHGAMHPDVASALNTLAVLYLDTGAQAKAQPLLRRALAINERSLGARDPETARSLNLLAAAYFSSGDYERAEPLYLRALAIREEVLGKEHVDTLSLMSNLAVLHSIRGAYAKAETLLRRALASSEKLQGAEQALLGAQLDTLAGVYRSMGAYARAEPLHQRALAIHEKVLGPEHPATLKALNNVALLYFETGDYARAEPLFQRSLDLREKLLAADDVRLIPALTNLALVYSASGAGVRAEPLLQRALVLSERVLGPVHPDTATALNNLANAYRDMGMYAAAEPLYRRTLAIREQALGEQHPNTAFTLRDLASLTRSMGMPAQAMAFGQRALSIYEKSLGVKHPSTAAVLDILGELAWAGGETTRARMLLQRAQDIDALHSDMLLLSGSEARKQAYLKTLTQNVDRDVSFSMAVPGVQSASLGLGAVLRYKGRALDAFSDNVARLRQSVDPADRSVLEQLAEAATQFSTLVYQGQGTQTTDRYRRRLRELTQRQQILETTLANRSREFRQRMQPTSVQAVRRAVPADTALIEWFRYKPFDASADDPKLRSGRPHYMAFVVAGERVSVVDVGEAAPIDAAISRYRVAVADPTRDDIRELAAVLSTKVVEPLLSSLGGVRRLLISPDGAMTLLPTVALPDEHGELLLHRFEITYLTSGRDLLQIQAATATGDTVLVANPSYGDYRQLLQPAEGGAFSAQRSGLIFRPLAGTQLEVDALQSLLETQRPLQLTAGEATEANLKKLHRPRILHIASHGFFLESTQLDATGVTNTDPLLRAGIALAGANARRSGVGDDGILTALEVAQLDLYGTQLVVLSACDSGVGEVHGGEGLYGLRRALVLAGVQTQITSLWKVADEPTRLLMLDYYRRLSSGAGRSAALREAQRMLQAVPEWSHPYFWAGFMPVGNTSPLVSP